MSKRECVREKERVHTAKLGLGPPQRRYFFRLLMLSQKHEAHFIGLYSAHFAVREVVVFANGWTAAVTRTAGVMTAVSSTTVAEGHVYIFTVSIYLSPLTTLLRSKAE